MVRNNHFNNRKKLDELLRAESPFWANNGLDNVLDYAGMIARIENAVVVVSDMASATSHIMAGNFAHNLDLGDYREEDSIWEKRILSLMSPEEQEEKYLAELRFFHFIRSKPKNRRVDYYLVSKLRFRFIDGKRHDVLHRMYYIFDEEKENIRYAVCIYEPLSFDFKGKSHAVNSVTGFTEELTFKENNSLLTPRECQVLSLIHNGLKSAEIAERLNISIHTVSRHRQEIIGKLQVKNSHEACRIAKALNII